MIIYLFIILIIIYLMYNFFYRFYQVFIFYIFIIYTFLLKIYLIYKDHNLIFYYLFSLIFMEMEIYHLNQFLKVQSMDHLIQINHLLNRYFVWIYYHVEFAYFLTKLDHSINYKNLLLIIPKYLLNFI